MRLAVLALFLCGCATPDCRNADWYDLGFRDAIFGLHNHPGKPEKTFHFRAGAMM